MLKNVSKKPITACLLACFISYSLVYANENGGLPIGLGQNLASGGAGAGFVSRSGSETIGALNSNPASAAMLGNEVSLFGQAIWIDQYVDSSAALGGNRIGKLKAKLNKSGAILFGGNYWVNDSLAFAFGVGGGMTPTKYDQSPVVPFIPNFGPLPNFSPTSVNNVLVSKTALFTPTVIYKPSDEQGYAVSAVLGVNTFKSNALNPLTLQETKGKRRTEIVYGAGARIGGLWKLTDLIGLGVSASSPVKFQKYKKYDDVIKYAPNIPGNITVGGSFHVTETFDILLDAKKIFFRSEKFYKTLKWKDQMVYMAGVQCNCMDNLSLRAGYNYGKSPIRNDGVFLNLLSPHIAEKHVTAGLMYTASDNMKVSLVGQYAFEKKLVDNGNGPFGILGKGAEVKSKRQTAIQLGVVFGF